MKRISSIVLLVLLFFSLFPGFADAENVCSLVAKEGLVPCGGAGKPSCTLCHLFVMLDRVIDFLLFCIIPPLAALMIAIGGLMYIVAYLSPGEMLPTGKKGGPKLFSQAKRLFTSVVFGLLIIYGAWIIINTFFMFIGVAEWTGLKEGWWQIPCP